MDEGSVVTMTIREVEHVQTSTRVFVAYECAIPIGFLTVDDRDDLIEMVYVDRRHRGLGIASRLLGEARRLTGLALTADRGDRTLAGSRWCRRHGIRVGQGYRRLADSDMAVSGARMMAAIYRANVAS
jgi:GNAT superfamily N-acetyltransferase